MTIISVESVVLLVKTYGGAGIAVPSRAKPNHYLAELIGMGDFKKLVAVFADTKLEIPACSRFVALMRAFSVLQAKRSGATHRALALQRHQRKKRIPAIKTRRSRRKNHPA